MVADYVFAGGLEATHVNVGIALSSSKPSSLFSAQLKQNVVSVAMMNFSGSVVWVALPLPNLSVAAVSLVVLVAPPALGVADYWRRTTLTPPSIMTLTSFLPT